MHEENTPLDTTPTNPPLSSSPEKLSFWTMLALVSLLPLFFVPSLSVSLLIAKNILMVLGVTLTALFYLIGVLRDGKLVLPKSYLLWFVLLLPLIYFVSSFSSISKQLSFFGYTLEVGTFASILTLFALMGLTTLVFNSRERIFRAFSGMFAVFMVIALFALIKLFSGGSLLVLSNFAGPLGNPIGSWTDYSIYFAIFAVLSVCALEWLPIKRPMRFFLYASFLLSIFMLTVINFSIAWVLSLVGALCILATSLYQKMAENREANTKKNLYAAKYAIGLSVISLIFVLNPTISTTSGSIGSAISTMFGIENSEVRPSWGATFDVTKPVLKGDGLLGSGPNTFGREWLLNKPAVINGTAFWNVAFPFGIGFIPTQLASTGVVGAVAWFVFLVLILFFGVKTLRKKALGESDRFMSVGSFLAAALLWAAAILYVPSLVILALAFIFTGLFISSVAQGGIIDVRTVRLSSPKRNLVGVVGVILILLGVVSFGFKVFQKTVSVIYFQKALVAANSGSQTPEWIKEKVIKANSFSPADLYLRALSTLAFNRAQIIANTTPAKPNTAEDFQLAYGEAVELAKAAKDLNPENYENWVGLGGLYEALVPAPLEVEGAYENAKSAYEEARKLNPLSPEIPLILARLEVSNKNIDAARAYIGESLALKNDYAAAYFLLARLEIGANNIPTAIQAAEAGAILSPGNAGVFFELGLLKYSTKDYQGAAGAFIEALKVVPDYANAQYFLGLSLYELGFKAEALEQFLALQKTNSENTEIQTIIANLRAGRVPLYPASNTTAGPAARTNPPLESAPAR